MSSNALSQKKNAVHNNHGSSLKRTITSSHLPSYASLKRTTRTWSTSNDFLGEIPELTSEGCSRALTLFMQEYDNKTRQNHLLALATESSSHPSGLVTLFAQPYVYAGGGLGNIRECPIELQTCLAGGNKRDSLTFAAVCIVPECTALDLAAGDFVGVVERAAGVEDERDALQTSYVELHRNIADLNKFLKTGWTCGEYKVPWKPFPLGLPYFVMLVGVMMLSVWGTCTRKKKHRSPRPSMEDRHDYAEEKKETTSETHIRSTPSPMVNQSYRNVEMNQGQGDVEDSKTFRIRQAFNVRLHIASLFRYRPETAALDGMRVVSILWVILGHVMAIQSSSGAGYNNPKDFLPPQGLTTTLGGQLLFASRFAVDTFLILSGYLVVHVLLAKLPATTISGRFWFLWNYIYTLPGLLLLRIMRILPVYAMSLGFWTQVAPHLGGGPFWYQWEPLLESCRMFGWTNLLFVNNFFPWNLTNTETCFYHSWYLALDVQLFLLAPLLVGWYRQSQVAGTAVTAMLLSMSVVVTMYLSFVRGWSLNTFDGAAVARFDVEGYAKPHVRAQTYLAGMLLAMMRHSSVQREGSNCRSRTSWKHRLAMSASLMCLAFITFCTVTGAYSRRACRYTELPFKDNCGSTWSPFTTFLYAATCRAFWALGITVIIALCLDNHGGIVKQFLSWKGWTPLSQLSFGAYLVHPIVIFVWQLGDTQKESFRITVFGMNYISVSVVSFAAALLLSVLVEFPCAALTKNFIGRQLMKRARKGDKAKPSRSDKDLIQLLPRHSSSSGDDPKYGAVRSATSQAAALWNKE